VYRTTKSPFYPALVFSNLHHLLILYAQSCRITLIAQVLPRLLAPVLATTSLYIYSHNVHIRIDFTTTIAFFISTNSLGHALAHCLKFFTAACEVFSYPRWLILLSNQLEIISYFKKSTPNPPQRNLSPLNLSYLMDGCSFHFSVLTMTPLVLYYFFLKKNI